MVMPTPLGGLFLAEYHNPWKEWLRAFRQARKILLKQDVRGMTYLMYAINPKAMCVRPVLDASNLLSVEDGVSDNWRGQRLLPPCTKSRSTEADASPRRDSGASDSVTGHHAGLAIHAANPWVPVVKRVLEFARQCLWMPEVRRRSFE